MRKLKTRVFCRSLSWKAVLMALVMCFLAGIISGAILIAYSLYYTAWTIFKSSAAESIHFSDPFYFIMYNVLFVTPSTLGALYLGLHVHSRVMANAAVYTFIIFLFMCPTIPFYWEYFQSKSLGREEIAMSLGRPIAVLALSLTSCVVLGKLRGIH